MSARYLIRLDDACPTMGRKNWTRLENIFNTLGIKPIVAVVPDNLDQELKVDSEDIAFWDRVRVWQAKGWTIALHGYQHVFHKVDRKNLILPFYDRSEFGGLSVIEQACKLRAAWAVCQINGVTPTAWIAPAHCFDRNTLEALLQETPIRLISDGISCNPYFEDGFFWLPQQLWSLKSRNSGLWTVCLHPNKMSDSDIDQFSKKLESRYYRQRIISVNDIEPNLRQRNLVDRLYATYFWERNRALTTVQTIRRFVRGLAE